MFHSAQSQSLGFYLHDNVVRGTSVTFVLNDHSTPPFSFVLFLSTLLSASSFDFRPVHAASEKKLGVFSAEPVIALGNGL